MLMRDKNMKISDSDMIIHYNWQEFLIAKKGLDPVFFSLD